MRPLILSMTAFGPFPGSETIRFTDLGENPLFLINGPTGSGKTTILDALCFVLYGKTTGDEREGAQMRCDLARSDLLTEVSLEFELAGRRFRIRRLPEQQRPKARGEGTTTQSPEAQLVELLADNKENLIVSSKVSEATREIEELTGLSVDQFRQVMVLPQGKFRQLLMADSSEREKIFSQLFQTRIYRRLEERLKTSAAEIRRERDSLLNVIRGILEGAELENTERLEEEWADLEPETAAARVNKQQKEQAFISAGQAYEQAKSLQDAFARLETVRAELTSLEQQKIRIDSDRQRLQLAEWAGKLQSVINERQRCVAELNQSLAGVEQAEKKRLAADQALAEMTQQQAEATQLQAGLDQGKQRLTQLDGYRQRISTVNLARQAWQQAATEAEQADLLLQYRNLADQQMLGAELEQLTRKSGQQKAFLEKCKDRGTQLRQRHDALNLTAKQLELAWHQGQAAVLAAELKPDAPCPVCGSLEHPNPASSDQPLPSQQQVEHARQAVQKTGEELSLARDQYTEEQERLHDLLQQQDRCSSLLGTENVKPASEIEEEISRLQALATKLQLTLPTPGQPSAPIDQLRTAAEEKRNAAATALTKAEAAEQELPLDYRKPDALDLATRQTKKEIEQCEQRLQQLAASQQQALGEARAAQAAAEAATQQQQKAVIEHRQADKKWETALEASPFASEKDWHEALVDDEQLEALKAGVAGHDAAIQRLSGALQQLQEQLHGKEIPDLVILQKALENAEEEKSQAVALWQQRDKRLSRLQDTRRQLQKMATEQAELERRYAVIGTLSDVANGQTGNKISLQRFVLSVLLDDVLIEASQRLSLMSKGRYQLLRKEDRAKGNKASGLELEVEDAYTGKVRSVATLSGGESFMAALSLALGLSDVVQAYAGGIRLDTLFIDEGFGSLDAESLDLAIRTLIDLQSGGRMVGIISHVAELKEQLNLQIEVLTGREGSHIRLHC